jgi:branched-chain amino acid transport system permease protein
MIDLQLVVETVVVGLAGGTIYVLFALGVTLLFGVSRIINLAHGEIFAIGGYAAFVFGAYFGGNPLVSLPVAALLGFAIGWFLDAGLVAPLRRRPQVEMPLEFFLILTLGLSLVLQNGLLAAFGDNYVQTQPLVAGVLSLPGGVSISAQRVIVALTALGLIVGMFAFLKRTKVGTAIRATSQDRTAAQAVGVNVRRIDSVTFAIAAALAAGAGALATPLVLLYPPVGQPYMITAIVIVIVAGLGNPLGVLWAGLGYGVVEAFGSVYLPAQFGTVVGLLVMVVVLLIRPSGLAGRRTRIEAEP